MKKQLFLVSAIAILAMSSLFTACEKDEEEVLPDRPTITAPLDVKVVSVNSTTELTFGIDIPGGFDNATFQATGGTFVVPALMSIEVGDVSGDITGTFTAGDVVGYGQVTLTVYDQNGKYDVGNINLQITE